MLRLATTDDADAAVALLRASRRAHLPWLPERHDEADMRRWMREQLLPTRRVWLCDEAGALRALLAWHRDAAGIAWIEQLYAAPGHTGRGLGAALLARAHDEAAGADPPCAALRLYCFADNPAARRFYERHGYRAIAFGDGSGNEEGCPDVLYERAAATA